MTAPYRVTSREWRTKALASDKGIPSIKRINQSIALGEIPGEQIAGTWFIYCDHEYEPLWDRLDKSKPAPMKPTKNKMADKILQDVGLLGKTG